MNAFHRTREEDRTAFAYLSGGQRSGVDCRSTSAPQQPCSLDKRLPIYRMAASLPNRTMTIGNSAAWSLMFTYAGPVFGKGFLAQVELRGRLLASPETDGVRSDGVNPGGGRYWSNHIG